MAPALKPVSPERLHRLFYPVVPVIVTVEHKERYGGMPAVSCMPISANPPLLALAIEPRLYTYELIEAAKQFAVNWVDFKHARKIALLGTTSGRLVADKLTAAGFTPIKGRVMDLPVLKEAVAVAECQLKANYPAGDHSLLMGEARAIYAAEDFTEYWSFTTYSPPLYVGGGSSVPQERWFRTLKLR